MHTLIRRHLHHAVRLMLAAGLILGCHAVAFGQVTPSNVASTAKVDASASLKPVWPDNGIGQRKAPDYSSMFIENDHGQWHAWILFGKIDHLEYGADSVKATALDFFTGKTMPVTESLMEGTHEGSHEPAPDFIDAKGRIHAELGKKFAPATIASISTSEQQSFKMAPLFETSDKAIKAGTECTSEFTPIDGGVRLWGEAPKWSKVIISRTPPNKYCPYGGYTSSSLVEAALDLLDGTILFVRGCHVVRLRIADLEPVGDAPAIRVIDASVVEKAAKSAREKGLNDPTQYLDQALHLNIDDANSCF